MEFHCAVCDEHFICAGPDFSRCGEWARIKGWAVVNGKTLCPKHAED